MRKVLRCKGHNLSQSVTSAIQVARNHVRDEVLNLTWSQALWFQQRLDVVKSCMYWDVPWEIENNKVQEALSNQFESLLQQYRVSFLREDLMKNVESSTYTVVKSGQRYLESMIEAHVGDKLAVPVDKDSKRRVLMDRAGYLYRLHEGYVEDERFYEKREEISVAELGSYRQHCASQYLPARVGCKAGFDGSNCQYAYHTYKGKCIGPAGGLSCQKQHAHEREIISDVKNPCKTHLRAVARAVRLIKCLSREHTWTLWKQSQLKAVLEKRVAGLKRHVKYTKCCPCGCNKPEEMSMIKIDAAQFFKSASLERGLRRVADLLRRVESKFGCNAVAIKKSARVEGHLCRSNRRSDCTHRVLSFDDIRCTLDFIGKERYFTVGDVIMKRRGGWPMGGSFSEPGTLVDLNEELRRIDDSDDALQDVGWLVEGMSLEEVVTGIMHVDDALVLSKVFCTACLEKGMRRLWPSDVGISLEEVGPTVRMLQCHVHAIGVEVHVRPYNPNVPYALGFAHDQKIARLGPFFGAEIHSCRTLRVFLHGKILAYNHLMQGSAQDMFVHVGFLLLEIERLGWPQRWMSLCLCNLSRRHVSPLISACRQVGKQLRHCSVGFLFQPCELVDLVRSSAVDKAVYAEMSRNWRNGGSQSWRPFGRNQQGADGGHVPKEVLDFMREEQRKRAEERQASEMQKHAKDAVMQMFGVHSSASDGAAAGSMQKSQPFEMLKWVAKKLSGNGGDPETSGAKQRKRRKRSTSSSGSCSSSTSLRAFRKKDKDKQKKKNKDEKKKARSDKKEKKTVERKLRPLTSSPLSVDKPVMSKERREELVKNLKLKIAEDVLMGDDWITEVAHAAKKDDLQKLAEKNGLSKTGSKHEIVEKIIAFMCGK